MNRLSNKGQALVIFIVFVPMFIMLGTLIVDVSYSKYEKRHIDEVNKMLVRYTLIHIDENVNDNIDYMINKNINDIEDYDLEVDNDNKTVTLSIKKNITGFFGKIIGKEIYKINSSYIGNIEDEKITIKEGDYK